MRKICYITGTRADFGLMRALLQDMEQDDDFDLRVIATGMHLLEKYGSTLQEVRDSGLNICDQVEVELSGGSGSQMSIAIGRQIIGFTNALEKIKPDMLLLLGDRGEMLAGAIAALHLNIPIVHIHGGELSGTLDEPIRHAISKLSHYHLTATKLSKERLVKMGELRKNIFVVGAPGLDEIYNIKLIDRGVLLKKYSLKSDTPFVLFLFHPVVQQEGLIKSQISIIMEGVLKGNPQVLALMPNADAGGDIIGSLLKEYEEQGRIKLVKHIERREFLSLMREADALVGNSSSGIIEAASLGVPVVNIGDRQNFRERSSNVIDVEIESHKITESLDKAISLKDRSFCNVYGNGNSSSRIIDLLKKLDVSLDLLNKVNAY